MQISKPGSSDPGFMSFHYETDQSSALYFFLWQKNLECIIIRA